MNVSMICPGDLICQFPIPKGPNSLMPQDKNVSHMSNWLILNLELLVRLWLTINLYIFTYPCACTFIMVKYKCNSCGKADIPTQAGLKVHIQLSKAGCQEVMERQTDWSLSPENDALTTWARWDNDQTPNDSNDASMDRGDI
jgi:hypothetical protein